MLLADGFEDAVIGVGSRCGQPDLVVYSYEKCVTILVSQGLSGEEAEEHLAFNVMGAWVGEETPIFLHEMNFGELQEFADECGV